VLRNFWRNYDIKQRIKFSLEFKNGEKLNIEMLWMDDINFYMLFEDLSDTLNKIVDGKYFAKIRMNLGGG
jgi:hypothetical protein